MTIQHDTTSSTATVSESESESESRNEFLAGCVAEFAGPQVRNTRMSRPCCGAVLIVLLAVATSICGCGSGSGSPYPVEPTVARQTLMTVLEGWKEEPSLERWREQHSDIVVQDMDWLTGHQLTSFEVLNEGRAVDANLHCDVRLTLVDANHKSTEKSVTYLVGTSPKRTVFRQVIP